MFDEGLSQPLVFFPPMNFTKKVIITGGPGSGKTTLINSLRQSGYSCFDEVAREVISEQLHLSSNIVPWLELQQYSEVVFERIMLQSAAASEGVCFFDRGAGDVIAYLEHGQLNVPEYMFSRIAAAGYCNQVFLLPPWKEIYSTDLIRREDFQTAMEISEQIRTTYQRLGFETIEVPRESVEERKKFILQATMNY